MRVHHHADAETGLFEEVIYQTNTTLADTAKTFEVLPDSRTTKSSSFTSPTEVLQDETD